MSDIQELCNKSEELLAHLQSYEKHRDDRDSFIEEIQRLLDDREAIIAHLKATPKTEWETDPEINARIVTMEPEITRLLKIVYTDIQKDRKLLKQKQKSHGKYRNPYANMPRDGAFLDKRK